MTIGIRNNNPLNVKQIKGNPWKGSLPLFVGGRPSTLGIDPSGHAIFYNSLYSVRAALRTLFQIQRKHGAASLYDLFEVYAPMDDDNKPMEYASFVSTRLGMSKPNLPLRIFDDEGRISSDHIAVIVIKAMLEFENFAGYELPNSMINSGLALYRKDFI